MGAEVHMLTSLLFGDGRLPLRSVTEPPAEDVCLCARGDAHALRPPVMRRGVLLACLAAKSQAFRTVSASSGFAPLPRGGACCSVLPVSGGASVVRALQPWPAASPCAAPVSAASVWDSVADGCVFALKGCHSTPSVFRLCWSRVLCLRRFLLQLWCC